MKLAFFSVSLHGLRVQVLLWIVLPVTLLMIVFSLTGIQSHQNSMRNLAVEENTRLAAAYAQLIATEVELYQLQNPDAPAEEVLQLIPLSDVLGIQRHHAVTSLLLLDAEGRIVYRYGAVPEQDLIGSWPGVADAVKGGSGSLFAADSEHGDVVTYRPVAGTPWVLLIREPWHSMADPLIRIEWAMPFILLVAVIVSLLILVFGLRYLVSPLQELGRRINLFGQGEFRALESQVGGVKEIEDLRLALSAMANRVQTYQGALHNYLSAITQAQDEERARLSRELHDETVQSLIALGHKAQMAQRSFQRGGAQTEGYLDELRQMIAQAIEEVRRFSRALRPSYLEELGLVAALESLSRDAAATLHIEGEPRRLSGDQETVLYRVAQEGLNNAVRHAQARSIELHLIFEPEQVTLKIRDDGVGFVVPASYLSFTQQGHFGMMGMYERALQSDARLLITSSPGSGTTLTLIFAATTLSR